MTDRSLNLSFEKEKGFGRQSVCQLRLRHLNYVIGHNNRDLWHNTSCASGKGKLHELKCSESRYLLCVEDIGNTFTTYT